MSDDVVIPGVVDPWFTTPPFPIGRRHTLYEWSMIYTDQNPAEGDGTGYLFRSGDHNEPTIEARDVRLRALGAVALRGNLVSWRNEDQQAITNAVYRMLVARTVPEIEVYLRDQPETLDYTLCVIDIAPVLDLARQRGDYGDAIGKLLAREAAAVQPAEDAQDASVAPPDGAAVTKEQGAAAAKPRKQRCDATRPEISRALDDLDGTEAWERAGPKARLGLVDQHLNKPAGWAKARTLGRAIEDRLKSGRHIGGTSALP